MTDEKVICVIVLLAGDSTCYHSCMRVSLLIKEVLCSGWTIMPLFFYRTFSFEMGNNILNLQTLHGC